MAYQNAVPSFNYQLPAGSLQEINCTFVSNTSRTQSPWPITGATWEYVVRLTPTSGGSPLFSLTPTPNSQGVITITNTASTSAALISIFPAATASLGPATYYHTLWMNPGTPNAYAWFTGNFIVTGNPQP